MNAQLVLLLAAALLIGLALLAFMGRQSRQHSRLDRALFEKHWKQVEDLLGKGESGQQLAIIEADKLLDKALQASGYPGETMGERLRDARHAIKNNDAVWQAHKLRNRIAHEHDVKITKIVAGRAIQNFKGALKDLRAL